MPTGTAPPSAAPTSAPSCRRRDAVIVARHGLQHRPSVFSELADPSRAHRALRVGRRLPRRHPAADGRAARVDARRDGRGFEARAYVDTGPVQERVYAQYAGLGWIGKNTCLINPELGSWIFLSEIICNLSSSLTTRLRSVRHVHAVPRRRARPARSSSPDVLDATRCLSYLTIENKGPIPRISATASVATPTAATSVRTSAPGTPGDGERPTIPPGSRGRASTAAAARSLAHADDELRALLKGSAMKRAGVRRLRRNLAVCDRQLRRPDAGGAARDVDEPTCRRSARRGARAWALEAGGHCSGKRAPTRRSGRATCHELLPERPTLSAVRDGRVNCKACDLYKRGTQTVFGEGPPKAEVMLVGEQPGDAEDLAGHPFVGPAGSCSTRPSRRPASIAPGLRHQRGQALQVGAAREAADPREAERGRDRGVPAVARNGDRAGEAAGARLPGGDRGAGAARQVASRSRSSAATFVPSPLAPIVTATVHPLSILRAPDDEARGGRRCGASSRT